MKPGPMRVAVPLPQSLADEHTLIAQKFAGYFVGHPYRAAQQRTGPGAIRVERTRPWREPAVVADGCEFCQHLTDEDAVRRVAGYQHAIDIEVLRSRSASFAEWLAAGSDEIPELENIVIDGETFRRGIVNSAANRRKYIETHAAEFDVSALPMVRLPLRLKRKLCIEWNHLYRRFLQENPGTWYDFDAREFYRYVDEPQPVESEHLKSWWGLSNPLGGAA